MHVKLVLLLLLVLSVPVFSQDRLDKLEKSGVDKNFDGFDDIWKMGGVVPSLFIPGSLIPSNWVKNEAVWLSNNNGGGSDTFYSFVRTIQFDRTAGIDFSALEVNFEFAASSSCAIIINGNVVAVVPSEPSKLSTYQSVGRQYWQYGVNTVEFRVNNNGGLLGFLFSDGDISYIGQGAKRLPAQRRFPNARRNN